MNLYHCSVFTLWRITKKGQFGNKDMRFSITLVYYSEFDNTEVTLSLTRVVSIEKWGFELAWDELRLGIGELLRDNSIEISC